jgi:hypothetical protein
MPLGWWRFEEICRMPGTSRSLTTAGLLALVFIGSGIALLVAAQFIDAPVDKSALRELTGTVTQVVDTKHYKEPADTVSFDLTIGEADGDEAVLQIVKQAVAPDVVRGLVNKEVTATHDGTLIYELRSGGATLFGYDDAATMVVQQRAALVWPGYASLTIGLLLAAWAHFTGRRLIN